MTLHHPKKEKGFALIISLILVGVFLLLATGISNVAFRSVIFASQANASVEAFYTADLLLECMLYYDTLVNRFATTSLGASVNVTCGTQTYRLTDADRNINPLTKAGTTTYNYNFSETNSNNDTCGFAKIGKAYNGERLNTTIEVRGYNTCNPNNPGRVERGIRAFIQ